MKGNWTKSRSVSYYCKVRGYGWHQKRETCRELEAPNVVGTPVNVAQTDEGVGEDAAVGYLVAAKNEEEFSQSLKVKCSRCWAVEATGAASMTKKKILKTM